MPTIEPKPMNPTTALKWIINSIVLLTGILITMFSMNHYADSGCDGGTCSLFLISHALPIVVSWLLLLVAFNVALAHRWEMFFLLVPVFLLNTFVYTQEYNYQLESLYKAPEIIYGFLLASAFLFLARKTEQSQSLSGNLLLLAYLIQIGYSLYETLEFMRLVNDYSMSSIIISVAYFLVTVVCFFLIQKQIRYGYIVLFLFTFYFFVRGWFNMYTYSIPLSNMIVFQAVNGLLLVTLYVDFWRNKQRIHNFHILE